MSVSVRCPGCQVACTVPAELLGRTGRCNKCARRIRLATPVAELLDDLEPATAAPTPAPVEDLPPLADLMPVEEPLFESFDPNAEPAAVKPAPQEPPAPTPQ